MRRLLPVAVAVTALLPACAVGPSYQRPPVVVPDALYGQGATTEARSLADVPWWDVFQDEALRGLIEEALAHGYDARLAAARVEEARARFGIASAAALPQLGYNAGYARTHTPEDGDTAATTESEFTVGVRVGWELDLWGRVRRLKESARAQYLATEEARHGVLLSLIADVATTYFQLRELDAELANARDARQGFQTTFDLFDRRFRGGAASGLETSRAEAALANVSATIPLIELQIAARESQIATLIGRPPGPVARGMALADQLVPPDVPGGLPSALLERRPDLREAEQNLMAATANVGVAKAAFFPTISLTGLLGGVSAELSGLAASDAGWSLGASLTGPLFQGGRIRSQHRVTLAQWDEARIGYEQAVNRALGEASTALVALQKLTEAEAERQRAVKANETALRLATLRYNSGLSAYFEVLDAQQLLLLTQNSLTQTRRDRLVALAQLYRVLGGGWSNASRAADSR